MDVGGGGGGGGSGSCRSRIRQPPPPAAGPAAAGVSVVRIAEEEEATARVNSRTPRDTKAADYYNSLCLLLIRYFKIMPSVPRSEFFPVATLGGDHFARVLNGGPTTAPILAGQKICTVTDG